MEQSLLFVLSQDERIITAVKSSNIMNVFSNIIFIENELYDIELYKDVKQLVSQSGFILSIEKIKKFMENTKQKDVLKTIKEENLYVLTIENYLDVFKNNDNNNELVEIVTIHFYHKNNVYHSTGAPAKLPLEYLDLFSQDNTVRGQNDKNENVIIGYKTSIEDIIKSKQTDLSGNDYIAHYNNFTKAEQIRAILNSTNYRDILKNNTQNIYDILSNKIYKNMLNVSMLQKILQIKDLKIDYVVGIESSGFCVGVLVAEILRLPFIPIRRSGYLTNEIFTTVWEKGNLVDNLEINNNVIKPESNILIIDDCVITGKTLNAANSLINNFKPTSTNFLVIRQDKEKEDMAKSVLGELYENVHVVLE